MTAHFDKIKEKNYVLNQPVDITQNFQRLLWRRLDLVNKKSFIVWKPQETLLHSIRTILQEQKP